LLLEVPGGQLAAAVEYKAVEEGPLDLGDLQFEVVADSVTDKLPAFAAQFTHPELHPPQPWAFRLWPLNLMAAAFAPVELTEQRYVQFLYVLQRGGQALGEYGHRPAELGEVNQRVAEGLTAREAVRPVPPRAALFSPWEEFAHLDDRWPSAQVWPKVREARLQRASRLPRAKFALSAQEFVVRRGRDIPGRPTAKIIALPDNRPALGAYRRRETQNEPAVPAPPEVELHPTTASRIRFHQLAYRLDRQYRRMWETESASDDARDMWRPYQPDGSRRWA